MEYPFTNLIFEGGGVKGIAYVGALQALEQRQILPKITRVGGTSAGAINAVLLALNYDLQEVYKLLAALNFRSFLDDSWGFVRDVKRLINHYGWYKGDTFREWMGRRIHEKTGNQYATFNDLRNQGFKDLYLIGTNLSTGYSEVFSFEHTPRMRVVDAARISMSIPLFFQAVRNYRNDVYVDGGIFNNYPIKLFDREKYIQKSLLETHARRTAYYDAENSVLKKIQPTSSPYIYNKQTLGFRLDTRQEIGVFRDGAEVPREKIDDFFEYAVALVKSILNVQNSMHLHSDDWHRTVYIDSLDVRTTDFDISAAKKKSLIKQGELGVANYFEWYDRADPEDMPKNHPLYRELIP